MANEAMLEIAKTVYKETQITVYMQLKNAFEHAAALTVDGRRATADEQIRFMIDALEKLIEITEKTN